MTMGPVGLGMNNSSAGEGQQQFSNQSIKRLTQSQVNTSKIKQEIKTRHLYHLNNNNNNSSVEVHRRFGGINRLHLQSRKYVYSS
jgi:hypothetical protein